MAQKRMFSKKITESDAFLDMPLSSQCLYFHLNMSADDDGFVNNPKTIMRTIGSTEDDLKLLIAKAFVLVFESGVIVIKHWRMNNTLQSDRYKPTDYQEEYALLGIKENNSYTWKQNGNILETECIHRIDKNSIDKNSIDKNSNICAELSEDNSTPTETPKYKMQLKHKNTYHPIYQSDIDHYQEFYPAVDVEQQIRSMVMWCESHPSERKTQTGIKAFITRWLNKEQNRVGNPVDELKRRTQEAYIKDVERKIENDKKGDSLFYDTN